MKRTIGSDVFLTACAITVASSSCSTYLKPSLHPDNANRPNLPLLFDPAEDLKPQSDAPGNSWFVSSNLFSGEHEFGFFVHYTENPMFKGPTFAITDVSNKKYYLEESSGGTITTTTEGFEVKSKVVHWTGSESVMQIEGKTVSGEASFKLLLRKKGPVLAYNGTGYFPLFENQGPTTEYAFPVMETTGTLTIRGKDYPITKGSSWFDRQLFGMMPARPGDKHSCWTWISIILSNGDVIGAWETTAKTRHSWVTVLHPDGSHTIADIDPVAPGMSGIWTSAKSHIKWPLKWELKIPALKAELSLAGTQEGQETFLTFARTESVIHVSGTYLGQDVTGYGFVEMVGDPGISN